MSDHRRGNLDKTFNGRHLVAAGCVLTLFLAGCVKDKPVATAGDVVQRQASAEAQPGLGDYIRTVFKLQQQGPPEAQSEVERLHLAKPELAALAENIASEPTDVESRRQLAAAYLEEGLLTEAYQLLEELRAVGTQSAALEIGLAEIWDQWGNFPLAHRHASSAVELEADNHRAWALMGRIQLHRGEFESASQAFAKALELGDSEDAYLLANLGYVHFKLGDWAAARPFLEAALEADDSLVEVHNNLGIALAHLNEDELALEHFRAVAEDKVAYNNLGVVQMERGDWIAAHSAFKQALALDPEYGKAAFNLGEAESFLPAPSVVDLGSFTAATVQVATVVAPPREASTTQLAALPSSGTFDLPEWPRTFASLGEPAISVAPSRSVLASVEGIEPAGLPWRQGPESWLPLTTISLASLRIESANAIEPVVVADASVDEQESSANFGFESQPVEAARPQEQTATVTRPEPTPATEEIVAEVEQTVADREPAVAAADAEEASTAQAASAAEVAPFETPAAVVASETVSQPVASETETAAEPETISEPAPPAAAIAPSDLEPVAAGSSSGRLLALLAVVGLGAAAGSLTAGRFWGLVGGLVGALAAAFTTLLRG